MNVLLWYQAFLEEGLISNVCRTKRGLTVVPAQHKFKIASLVEKTSKTVSALLFESLRFVVKFRLK